VYRLLRIRRVKEAAERKKRGEPTRWKCNRRADEVAKVLGRVKKRKPAADAGVRRKRRRAAQ
jgi:hypothetical protein